MLTLLHATQNRKLICSSQYVLMHPTEKEREGIKGALTFNNPAHASALQYSKYNYTNIPPYLFYYKEEKDSISFPIGFEWEKYIKPSSVKIEDTSVAPKVSFPPFVLTPRDDQRAAAEAYLNSKSTHNSICLPTGKGKTILSLYIASKLNLRTLVVVHKDDLIASWTEDSNLCFDGQLKMGLIKARKRTIGEHLTLATIQTLNNLTEEELSYVYSQFGFIIQDEMHHCPASEFSMVSNFPAKYRLGVTATPERSDGLTQVMFLYMGQICYQYRKHKNEEEQDILPAEVLVRNIPQVYFDPSCKRVNGKYYVDNLLAPIGDLPDGLVRISSVPYEKRPKVQYQTVEDVVVRNYYYKSKVVNDIITEYGKGHSCVVFFTQIEHLLLYAEELSHHMRPSHILIYYGNRPENEEAMKKAQTHRDAVTLTTFGKSTEGTNCPMWECEFLVSSLNNAKNTEQAAGRVRRIKEYKIPVAKIYDYRVPNVYQMKNHGRTRDERYQELGFTISGKAPVEKRKMFERGRFHR